MDAVQGWVFTLCTGMLICGVTAALLPGESFKKPIQLLLGLFLLCCILTPVQQGSWTIPTVDLEAAESRRQQVAQNTDNQLREQLTQDSATMLEPTIYAVLAEQGIAHEDCQWRLAEEQNGQLYLWLSLPWEATQKAETTAACLKEALGLPVTVHILSPQEESP